MNILLTIAVTFFAGMGAMRLALTVDYAGLDLQNGAIAARVNA